VGSHQKGLQGITKIQSRYGTITGHFEGILRSLFNVNPLYILSVQSAGRSVNRAVNTSELRPQRKQRLKRTRILRMRPIIKFLTKGETSAGDWALTSCSCLGDGNHHLNVPPSDGRPEKRTASAHHHSQQKENQSEHLIILVQESCFVLLNLDIRCRNISLLAAAKINQRGKKPGVHRTDPLNSKSPTLANKQL
jgi:hypothetical protein